MILLMSREQKGVVLEVSCDCRHVSLVVFCVFQKVSAVYCPHSCKGGGLVFSQTLGGISFGFGLIIVASGIKLLLEGT